MYEDIKRPSRDQIKPRDDGIRRLPNKPAENTEKNQIHLGLGSAEYRERLLDKAGVDDRSFTGDGQVFASGSAVGEVRLDEGSRVESDEFQETHDLPAGEYATGLSGQIRDAAQAQRDRDVATSRKKYQNRMQKLDQYPEVMRQMQAHAEATETLADDKAVEKLKSRDCDDMPPILDDGVTADDFTMRSFQKYM